MEYTNIEDVLEGHEDMTVAHSENLDTEGMFSTCHILLALLASPTKLSESKSIQSA
jgi:hypothetical protein